MRWGPLFLAMQNQLVTTVTVTLQLTQNMGSSDGRSSRITILRNEFSFNDLKYPKQERYPGYRFIANSQTEKSIEELTKE